MACIVLFCT